MPSFNIQMLTNVLASALTSTVSAVLAYLAAWSHFSSADNSALAAIIAAGLAIMIGQMLTLFLNRYSALINAAGTNGTRVLVSDQKVADALPNNDKVLGPNDATLTMKP